MSFANTNLLKLDSPSKGKAVFYIDEQYTGQEKSQYRFMLLPNQTAAICLDMLSRFGSLLVIFALLFATVILPSVAHAAAPEHSEEAFERHEHNAGSNSDKQDDEGDQPCHAVTHHHCSFALRVEANAVNSQLSAKGSQTRPVSSVAKPSWSQAPPTQPPSA